MQSVNLGMHVMFLFKIGINKNHPRNQFFITPMDLFTQMTQVGDCGQVK